MVEDHITPLAAPTWGVLPEHGVQRPAGGGQDAQRHQGVHGGRPMAGGSERRPVEGPGRPGQHGCGQDDQQPLPVRESGDRNQREDERQVAEGHEQEGGDKEPTAQEVDPLVIVIRRVDCVSVADDLGRVSGTLHGIDQGVRRRRHGQEDPSPFRCIVDRCFNAVESIEPSLDEGGTGSAGHPADRQRHLCGLGARGCPDFRQGRDGGIRFLRQLNPIIQRSAGAGGYSPTYYGASEIVAEIRSPFIDVECR